MKKKVDDIANRSRVEIMAFDSDGCGYRAASLDRHFFEGGKPCRAGLTGSENRI